MGETECWNHWGLHLFQLHAPLTFWEEFSRGKKKKKKRDTQQQLSHWLMFQKNSQAEFLLSSLNVLLDFQNCLQLYTVTRKPGMCWPSVHCALLWGLMLENSAGRACALYLRVSQMAACYCSWNRSGQLELLLDVPPVLNVRVIYGCCRSHLCLHIWSLIIHYHCKRKKKRKEQSANRRLVEFLKHLTRQFKCTVHR